MTSTFPGVVKAWYRHHFQVDQLAPVTGLVKLVLYDDRRDSPTNSVVSEILLDEQAPKLVQIPTGVWHGFKTIGEHEAILLHVNSRPYAFDEVDEDRLPPDDPSIPHAW
jgi:dTDP-4-dehydrorhamnose 3,5-epimerase